MYEKITWKMVTAVKLGAVNSMNVGEKSVQIFGVNLKMPKYCSARRKCNVWIPLTLTAKQLSQLFKSCKFECPCCKLVSRRKKWKRTRERRGWKKRWGGTLVVFVTNGYKWITPNVAIGCHWVPLGNLKRHKTKTANVWRMKDKITDKAGV